MPRRDDIHTILILGSGPIVIGQGCEFDYSGTQACKALRSEGYRVALVNSNPATIMTDPQYADRTYIEPITAEAVTKIIEAEAAGPHPIQAILPTMGGQTALNVACQLHDSGVLRKHGVEMIGATRDAIYRAEDRELFKRTIEAIGLKSARCATAHSLEEAWRVLETTGLPAIIRPAFTLGGTGGGVAYTREEFELIVRRGLDASMNRQVLIDESLLGWKEYELEVIRDRNDNCIIVCGIENIDPMGVHTGDSITVAPIMTLTDKEYQRMRDAAIAILRAVGVETGGSNVQFAVNPRDGTMLVVEMNPRVSRSSALASKATGYPIAKIAAKLAVGYTLDELRNDITGTTSACFEPSIDYVVVKMPRWTFEKFPEADETLTTQMKSVGEAMSIGRTFKESFQKSIRSMEVKRFGLGLDKNDKWLAARRATKASPALAADGSVIEWPIPDELLVRKLTVPSQGRLYYIRYALKMGWSVARVNQLTNVDPWFLDQISQLCEFEDVLCSYAALEQVPADVLRQAKQFGYSDPQLANLYLGDISTKSILAVRGRRKKLGIEPVYKLVDTCAAEFEAQTPYYYSTYENSFVAAAGTPSAGRLCDDEIRVTAKPKIVVLGGGPNRIGQGIEFDYCCCQASFACRELGFESVMINSNPETVSTDYDTSDLLFFEPLTLEDVLNVVERLNGPGADALDRPGNVAGVIVQLGGQTPLNLAQGLKDAGVPIIGTTPESIHLAADREAFGGIIRELGLRQPANGIAYDLESAKSIARELGYPVLLRPSYVLGGRGMEICAVEADVERFMRHALSASDRLGIDGRANPILIDKFLKNATEVDVDCVADFGSAGEGRGSCAICGVMEHIEEAGIHSGDSSCAIPPYSLSPAIIDELKDWTTRLARRVNLCGLMNVQYAIKDNLIYVLEVNPRASRTVPFVSKATGVSWAHIATRVLLGQPLESLTRSLRGADAPWPAHVSVKASVFPFSKFPGVDVILGPEMRSTGEVMGIDSSFGLAFAKSQMAAGSPLPTSGTVLISLNDADKPFVGAIGRAFQEMAFRICATVGTRKALAEHGVDSVLVSKSPGAEAPYLFDLIREGKLSLMINTPLYIGSRYDEGTWRAAAINYRVPLITTITGARAAVAALRALRTDSWGVKPLQDHFPQPK
ncbi:MAG: carbamoyl-phosphate synthase large subunit [Phycisphaerae bacterium]|nr:carbamoyl-phosphate synthase large subunit [Phycisphaerae bacterium]